MIFSLRASLSAPHPIPGRGGGGRSGGGGGGEGVGGEGGEERRETLLRVNSFSEYLRRSTHSEPLRRAVESM